MRPHLPTDSESICTQTELLSVPLQGSVLLSDSEVDARQAENGRSICSKFEDDPPTTESEILAAILATRHELATGVFDADAAMDRIARLAQFLADARGAVVELLEGTELVNCAAPGTAAKSLGIRVDSRKSMSGLCFHSGKAIQCDDTESDDRVDKAACRWVGIRSMVLVPLIHDGCSIGVLAIISPAIAAFGERDVRTLQLMAELLSGSIASALPASRLPANSVTTPGRRSDGSH